MFQGIGEVLTVAMRPRVLRLLRVVVALLRVGVVPRGRDLQQLHDVAVLPVAASASSQFLPWRLMDLREKWADDWRQELLCCETRETPEAGKTSGQMWGMHTRG